MEAPSTPTFQGIRMREHLWTSELWSALCICRSGRQPDPSLLHMLELGLVADLLAPRELVLALERTLPPVGRWWAPSSNPRDPREPPQRNRRHHANDAQGSHMMDQAMHWSVEERAQESLPLPWFRTEQLVLVRRCLILKLAQASLAPHFPHFSHPNFLICPTPLFSAFTAFFFHCPPPLFFHFHQQAFERAYAFENENTSIALYEVFDDPYLCAEGWRTWTGEEEEEGEGGNREEDQQPEPNLALLTILVRVLRLKDGSRWRSFPLVVLAPPPPPRAPPPPLFVPPPPP